MLNKLIIFIVTEDSDKSSSSMLFKTADTEIPHNVAPAMQARNSTSGSQYTIESHLQSFREGWTENFNEGKVLEYSLEKLIQGVPTSIKHYKSQI